MYDIELNFNIKVFKMSKGNTALLADSKSAINQCGKLLKEISTSCCIPERSPNMAEAFKKIDSILQNLELSHLNAESVHKSISDIGSFGSMIGYLFATCCTETRVPLYQQMYKEMNKAHTMLWQYMGHSH